MPNSDRKSGLRRSGRSSSNHINGIHGVFNDFDGRYRKCGVKTPEVWHKDAGSSKQTRKFQIRHAKPVGRERLFRSALARGKRRPKTGVQ
ncbi:Hypothetical predicted protein [Podarcis lilfordi]|uniref:Uncharacterized protein n=1 Tax=Podarcis lilfordi TaxID=74358 RepID=A0AA35LE84_9SAUR|nr:Hypothetical predicted protein [Podarcis lilfordi]